MRVCACVQECVLNYVRTCVRARVLSCLRFFFIYFFVFVLLCKKNNVEDNFTYIH